jgi:hypothetical protein
LTNSASVDVNQVSLELRIKLAKLVLPVAQNVKMTRNVTNVVLTNSFPSTHSTVRENVWTSVLKVSLLSLGTR